MAVARRRDERGRLMPNEPKAPEGEQPKSSTAHQWTIVASGSIAPPMVLMRHAATGHELSAFIVRWLDKEAGRLLLWAPPDPDRATGMLGVSAEAVPQPGGVEGMDKPWPGPYDKHTNTWRPMPPWH